MMIKADWQLGDLDHDHSSGCWTQQLDYKKGHSEDQHTAKIEIYDWDKEHAIEIATAIVDVLNEKEL
jgi:hypothetical protein